MHKQNQTISDKNDMVDKRKLDYTVFSQRRMGSGLSRYNWIWCYSKWQIIYNYTFKRSESMGLWCLSPLSTIFL